MKNRPSQSASSGAEKIHPEAGSVNNRSKILRYLVALGCVVVAFAIRYWLTPPFAGNQSALMDKLLKAPLFWVAVVAFSASTALAKLPTAGTASWYGEAHRGKPMANGKKFDPDKLTAASWFYPLGAKVRVRLHSTSGTTRSVLVTITDRGPAKELVRVGRIIDLARAAFKKLAPPELGLVEVKLERVK